MKKILNYINGELIEPSTGSFLDNISPANKKVYSQVPDSNEQDVLLAIKAGKEAFSTWSNTSVKKRGEILRKIASLIKEKSEELARAESIDNGKPISLARKVDIPRSSQNLEFFADAMTSFKGEAYDMGEGVALNYTLRSPLGVVTCISPWNLPLYLFTWKIAPALMAGNTVVAKPSEVTPMTAYLFSEICKEAGLPPGVLNIVHGLGSTLGETLTTHPDVKAVSFTGSTQTGKIIAQNTAKHLKKVSLELGGKNPNIIFADCDFEEALETTLRSTFANQGQICLCGSRIFVERSIYEKFRDALIEKANQLKVGDPLDENSQQGAVVSKEHYKKVLSYIELAKEEGGKVLCGGDNPFPETGYFIRPTLIEDLDPLCKTNQDEIFGPVASITPFDSEDEVIEWANSTRYGLAGTIWTQNITRAQKLARKVQSGILWINCWLLRDLRTPFGGVKESGIGREGGEEALRFFTEVKNICIKG